MKHNYRFLIKYFNESKKEKTRKEKSQDVTELNENLDRM